MDELTMGARIARSRAFFLVKRRELCYYGLQ